METMFEGIDIIEEIKSTIYGVVEHIQKTIGVFYVIIVFLIFALFFLCPSTLHFPNRENAQKSTVGKSDQTEVLHKFNATLSSQLEDSNQAKPIGFSNIYHSLTKTLQILGSTPQASQAFLQFYRIPLSPNPEKIQTHPQICFNFFNWSQKYLDFKPDIGAQCEVIRILFGSELSNLGRPILNSIIQDHPPAKIVSLLQPRTNPCFQNVSQVLNSVIQCYCSKQMYFQSLEVFQMAKQYEVRFSMDACNTLLNLLADKNEPRLSWCYYASIIRNGNFGDSFTWSVIAKILYKDGKFERISRIFDMGIYAPEMFDLIIDGYSKRGDFAAAFGYLNEMCSKGIEPSFSTYSAMLDSACRHQNSAMIDNVMFFMVDKGYIMKPPASDYDLIIQKLCAMGKTYAVDLFFKRASVDNIELKHATYECMLRALLSEEGRVKDAVELNSIMQDKNILVGESCCNEFVNALCKENPSQKTSRLLFDIIMRRGLNCPARDLSNYIGKQCAEGQWREAEELLDLVLSRGWLLDSLCLGLFMKRYCSCRQIDKAVLLHNRIAELNGSFDMATYNVLLGTLLREKRIEETMKVFDHMKACKDVNSESFALMIRGLCHEKEMRKAMKLHDEMLEMGLKPDKRTYKRLISGFR